jgi:hypothetical protein
MVLAHRLAWLAAGLFWCESCATQKGSFDFSGNLGLVTTNDGRACLSLPGQRKVSYPVFIILPEPETATYTAHINDGSCQAEDGMIGHPLSWRSDKPVVAFGVVLNGRPPSRDLDHDGKPERFRQCASSEGLHLTVWSREVRRWHRYHYLGYDTEANCTEPEYRATSPLMPDMSPPVFLPAPFGGFLAGGPVLPVADRRHSLHPDSELRH